MQLFAKFKKIPRRGFRATLNFRKFEFVDTMILASTDKDVVIMIHQTVSLGKYCKLFPSTLNEAEKETKQRKRRLGGISAVTIRFTV